MAANPPRYFTVMGFSAITAGIIILIYLLKPLRKTSEAKDRKKEKVIKEESKESEQRVIQSDTVTQSATEPKQEAVNDVPSRDMGDSFTVSQSWAVLNGNNDSRVFPGNLSPCQSAVMLDSTLATETESSMNQSDLLEFESVPSGVNLSDMGGSETDSTLNQSFQEVSEPSEAENETTGQVCEAELVQGPEMNLHYEQLLKAHNKSSEDQIWSKQQITEALMAAQNPQNQLSAQHSEILVFLMSHSDPHLKHVAIKSISNCATFTYNQNTLREHGCLEKLSKLLELQHMAMWLRHNGATTSIEPTINAVTNLAVNAQNNDEMEPCVPTLVDISLDKDTGETVCLSSLQALTNLSVTSKHHGHYTRLVQRLYEFLSVDNAGIQLQALKILINLSCNANMVPNLLAAKAPDRLLEILQPSQTQEAVILRFVTLLANILNVVRDKQISASSLPTDDKAPSPETMYTALLGISSVSNLKNKIFLLCKHSNDEIKMHAAKVYHQLK